jgi:DNA polymerase III subunit epsilon
MSRIALAARTSGIRRASQINNNEEIAAKLEESGDYRVLRRLQTPTRYHEPDGGDTKLAIFLDLETTGLDPAKDEIIEIAMVPFTYSSDGRIFDVHEAYNELQEPSSAISVEITQITGITNEMVAGHNINAAKVAEVVDPAALIIAHNAAFDRRFAERAFDVFSTKAWVCSMTQVPWKDEQLDGLKLEFLAMKSGFFYDAHRATTDCFAAIELLAQPLPQSGTLALAALLETARQATYRVWAEGSPYDFKDILKARGYRWNDGNDGQPKSWYRDVSEAAQDEELSYLRQEIYQREVDIPVVNITAFDRFSDRV